MASVKFIHFSKQEQYSLEYIDAKCHLCALQSTCRLLCNKGIHLIASIEHTHANISALECQMSWSDTTGEVVDHQCNLAYGSKQGK